MRLDIVQNESKIDLILTTYNMVISSPDDRVIFKQLTFGYAIFDEAHMLKNMSSQRYEQLMKINCRGKL